MRLNLRHADVFVATGGQDFDAAKPTVLFIHGSGLDHRCWALQTRWFAFNGYSVLAPDLPGHSLSTGEALDSIEAMAECLLELLQVAGVHQAHVVGHSQGFLCALEMAQRAPEQVASLTGLGTAAAIPVNPDLISAAEQSAAKAAGLMLQWGFGAEYQMGGSAVPGLQPMAVGHRIMAANPLAEDLKACAAYEGGEAAARAVSAPARLVIAGKDRMTPAKAGMALAEELQAEVELLPHHGHMLPMEAPLESLAAIRRHVERVHRQAA